MKKKMFMLVLLISTALILSACSTDKTETKAADSSKESGTAEADNNSTDQETEADTESEENTSIEVDKDITNVELTIPASLVEGQTQEELDATCKEKGYKSITLNDDGSAAYVMSKKQHEELMADMTDTINGSINDMIGSEDYPDITDIQFNDTYTEFTITTTSEELDMVQSLSVFAFYMYGGMYNAFNGTNEENISVTFVNADTGETISTSNSSELGN